MPAPVAGYVGFPDAYIHWYKTQAEADADARPGDILVRLENGRWGIDRRRY